MIDNGKEVERYETAKPSKNLRGLYESPVRKSTLLYFFFHYFFIDCLTHVRMFLCVLTTKNAP